MHLLLLLTVLSQGMPIKSGATSDLLTVNTQKAALVTPGISTRPTYGISFSGAATTALFNLSVESSAGTGFKVAGWCVGFSNATAAVAVTVTLQRRTTAAASGTLCVNEQTSACAISTYDPADAAFGGTARQTATLGSAGAILDAVGLTAGEIGAGTADSPGPAPYCRFYGTQGDKMPTVSAGTSNGVSLNVSSIGSGGLAAGSITMYVIYE